MELKGNVHARDIVHTTVRKIALGKENPQLLVRGEYMKMKPFFAWTERGGLAGELTCLPLPVVAEQRGQRQFS